MSNYAVLTEGLTKQFNTEVAVNHLSLKVKMGEILALVGPSGCGKTTALRLIAGFEKPEKGTIHIGGRIVSNSTHHTPPEARGVGMVFQDYALFPHLTVYENVAFGVKNQRKIRAKEDIMSMLALVSLENYAQRLPHELSGGQRQRVALARALAPKPVLILLDEPFSNLDADLRSQMREEVRVILKGIKTSAIFVTHDQEEALYIGDRLGVMVNGRIEQVGTPEEVFSNPKNRFVAEFMGNTDFLPGTVTDKGIKTEIGLILQKTDLPPGTEIELAVRADDITFKPQKDGGALVLARHFKGAMNIYRLRLPSGRLLHAYAAHTTQIRPGTPVKVWEDAGHILACFHNSLAVPTTQI